MTSLLTSQWLDACVLVPADDFAIITKLAAKAAKEAKQAAKKRKKSGVPDDEADPGRDDAAAAAVVPLVEQATIFPVLRC